MRHEITSQPQVRVVCPVDEGLQLQQNAVTRVDKV
jgi:hypothetical protein